MAVRGVGDSVAKCTALAVNLRLFGRLYGRTRDVYSNH